MMKPCECCGGIIDPHHPFVVCAKCLLGDALKAAPTDVVGSERGSAVPANHAHIHHNFFEKYELMRRLQEGGQGEVYETWDFDLRRRVAMKRLAVAFLDSEAAKDRFFAEAQIASQLEHPGILPIHDVGVDPDGRPFFTTPVLPGNTLEDEFESLRVRERSDGASLHRALELLIRVCEIVAFAHSRGVIHRDLKPSNILVGSFEDIRVIDWGSAHVLPHARAAFAQAFTRIGDAAVETDRSCGIARALDSPLATRNAGQPVTPLFAPPEILRGELALLGPATDIYAVGVMLYKIVSGRLPYSNSDGSLPSSSAIKELVLKAAPDRLRWINFNVPRDLTAIVEKAMARDPASRYASMQAVGEDLRAFLEIRPVKARKLTPVGRIQKWARRNSSYVAFGSLAFVLVALLSFAALRLKAQKDHARQMSALREADLSARSGRWRAVITQLARAESAGYRDTVDLSLQRMEALESLGQPAAAHAELEKVIHRRDLGHYQGVVLLRAGENELFSKATSQQGIQHIKAALTAGLDPADRSFAEGLIAESIPEALGLFHDALKFNPYHRSAQRLSLGLEFMLGRHAELEPHLSVFKVLFPDDPSPVIIEATQLSLQGKLPQAEALLTNRPDVVGMQGMKLTLAGFKLFAELADYIDLDVALGDRKATAPNVMGLIGSAMGFVQSHSTTSSNTAAEDIRFPQLPCVNAGIEEAIGLLGKLILGSSTNLGSLANVKEAWDHFPEGLLPFIVASLQSSHRPTEANGLRSFLTNQAGLYELATASSSMLPKVPRLARFLAVQAQFERAQELPSPDGEARAACINGIRSSLASKETSSTECEKYFEMAMQFHDSDLAREILFQMSQHVAASRQVLERRVRLDIETGAFGRALSLLNPMLIDKPADPWAIAQRRSAMERLQALAHENSLPTGHKE